MVTYSSNENATLANVLTFLSNNKIGPRRIINVFHNGTNYVAVYVTE